MASTTYTALLRRARERAWIPMAERVELLCALSVLRDETAAYDTFLEHAAEVIGEHYGGGCALSVVPEEGRTMHVIGAHHPDPAARAELEHFLGRPVPVLDHVEGGPLDSGEGSIFPLGAAELEDRPEARRYAEVSGATYGAVVPMRAQGGVTGLLWLSVPQTLTGDDLCFLTEIAARVGLVVDHLRLGSGDVDAEAPVEAGPIAQLSRREREILTFVALGMTSKQIAERLVLSARTVEWHRGRIQTKLGVSGRAELTRIAHQCNLVRAAA